MTETENRLLAHATAWAEVDLTIAQWQVLLIAAASGRVGSPEVGRTLKMLPSTLTRIVDRLVDRGLIERARDAADRRVVWLQPTEEGNALVNKLLG
jgi:DNA-binding MarR family transcriptional regulator